MFVTVWRIMYTLLYMDIKNHHPELIRLGLTDAQVAIYSTLLRNGLMLGRNIVLKTGIKKGLVYKTLEQLIEMGLVEKKDRPNKASLFFPAHPRTLEQLAQEKRQEADESELLLGNIMGNMVSQYNLLKGKPNVQFFEGFEGITRVIYDNLDSETPILGYFDTDAISSHYQEIDIEYRKKRHSKKVLKKMIFPGTAQAERDAQHLSDEYSEVRLLETIPAFATVLQIYDNKVSYITLEEGRQVGIIIEDPAIYQMHVGLFETHWAQAQNPKTK